MPQITWQCMCPYKGKLILYDNVSQNTFFKATKITKNQNGESDDEEGGLREASDDEDPLAEEEEEGEEEEEED